MKTLPPIPHAPYNRRHPLCDVVGRLLYELRIEHHWSRLDLAEETHISDEMIRLVETRACIERLDRAIRHAEGLGVPFSAVMREAELRYRRSILG